VFLGGRFAVPVGSPPDEAGVVGEAEDVAISMPGDGSDWLYLADGQGVARWLSLPGPRAVSTPPEALLMGDSILAGSEPFVSSVLGEWSTRIDAVDGRPSAAGVAIAAQSALAPPDVAVVELGTNDADPVAFRAHADGILASFAALPLVLWVNVHSPAAATAAVNREIRLAAASVPNAAIANWNAAAPAADLSADGVHLSPGHEAAFAEFLTPFLLAWHAANNGRGATRCLGTVAAAARTS
jgi:lysophospholipase L1-like esterase